MKIYEGKIPFDEHGNLHGYADHWDKDVRWQKNSIFSTALIFLGFARGRSAAHAIWRDVYTGATYKMFLKDLSEVLSFRQITYGQISDNWVFCKRGANYGIKLARS